MSKVPYGVLLHAENALNASEETMAVLDLWLSSFKYSPTRNEVATKVCAVMTLVQECVNELEQAMQAYNESKKDQAVE